METLIITQTLLDNCKNKIDHPTEIQSHESPSIDILNKIPISEGGNLVVTFDNIMDNTPFPPPININREPIGQSDVVKVDENMKPIKIKNPYKPGRLEISEQGELTRKNLEFTDFTRDLVQSYDNMIIKFKNRVSDTVIHIKDNYYVKFTLNIEKPMHSVSTTLGNVTQNNLVEMTPLMARQQNETYSGEMTLNIQLSQLFQHSDKSFKLYEIEGEKKSINMGKIPVMLGSKYDTVSNYSEDMKIAAGECPYDVNGYFIINGMEYIILLEDGLRTNRFLVYPEKIKENIIYISTNTTYTHEDKTSMVHVFKDPNTLVYKIWFGMLGNSADQLKPGHSLNILQIIRMLIPFEPNNDPNAPRVPISINTIINIILSLTKPKNMYKSRVELEATIGQYQANIQIDDFEIFAAFDSKSDKYNNPNPKYESYRKESGVDKVVYDETQRNIYRTKLYATFFANHVDIDQFGNVMDIQSVNQLYSKTRLFSILINKLIEVYIGDRVPDDRDSWSNKIIKPPSFPMYKLLNGTWSTIIKSIYDADYSKIQKITINDIPLSEVKITDKFVSSFTTNWDKGMGKMDEKKTDILSRTSMLSSFAYVTRISRPGSRDNKLIKLRIVDNSQWGFIDHVDTPEGANVGLVSAKSIGCWISLERDENKILMLIDKGDIVQYNQGGNSVFILNGKYMGFCKAAYLRDKLLKYRRNGCIAFDVSIIYIENDNILYVYSDEGRLVRPVLIVNEKTQTLVMYDKMKKGEIKNVEFEDLINNGCIEYIDSWEQEFSMISQSMQELKSRANDIINQSTLLSNAEELLMNEQGAENNLYVSIKSKGNPILITKDKYTEEIQDKINILEELETKLESTLKHNIKVVDNKIDEFNSFKLNSAIDDRISKYFEVTINELENIKINRKEDYDIIHNLMLLQINDMKVDINKLIELFEQRHVKLGNQLKKTKENIESLKLKFESESIVTKSYLEEYVDSLKKKLTQFKNRKGFSHCEMDPNSLFGVSASIVPLPDHNQGPRNTFQCNMGRQALGIYFSNHKLRFDSAVTKTLAYPGSPIFKTQAYKPLGLDKLGSGETVTLAIMQYLNLQEEDAILVNQSAVEKGFGTMIFYKTIASSLDTVSSGKISNISYQISEEFILDFPRNKNKDKSVYANLDENGLVRIGSSVNIGDCIIGKVRIETGSKGDVKKIDKSSYVRRGEEGIVESIISHNNTRTVKIRKVMTQIVGNKFATRHAQKSTIGKMMPAWKFPMLPDGSRPTVIMNPHAIPSRMTLGQLYEMVAGKASLRTGNDVNSTAFNEFSLDEFKKVLKVEGFNEWGWETLRNGMTGQKFRAQIFVGPVFYQALKHQVIDKAQVRGRGLRSDVNRQPIPGRIRGGGLRFGYMERDAILSHGASELIREIYLVSSDKYKCMICSKCRNVAYIDSSSKYHCRVCADEADIGNLEVPFSHMLTQNLLAGAGISLKITTSKKPEPLTSSIKTSFRR